MTAAGVREALVRQLRRNLVGPSEAEDADLAAERLPAGESPSRWYLTGFIAPSGELTTAGAADALSGDAAFDDVDMALAPDDGFGAGGAAGDHDAPDPPPARRRFLPSSIGLSAMLDPDATTLEVALSWGDYVPEPPLPPDILDSGVARAGEPVTWRRVPCARTLALRVPREDEGLVTTPVPGSAATARPGGALVLGVRARAFRLTLATGETRAVRVVTVFLVNARTEPAARYRDLAYAYQVRLELRCEPGFAAQHDLSRIARDDWDEQLADLHYRDAAAYAVGLGCATGHRHDPDGVVRRVHTTHLPRAAVERTVTAPVAGVEFAMDALAALADGDAVHAALDPLVAAYADWHAQQRAAAAAPDIADAPQRARTAATLIAAQAAASTRIEAGIALLATDTRARTAFAIANRAVADAARARRPADAAPAWRAFQLAFLLLNLAGMADRRHPDRAIADLLFFPTGGGKTEAYLGLAAFTIAHRRLGAAGLLGAGVGVVMRYTLRLLTLDQLGRAAGVVCALELLRDGPDYRGADGRPLLGDWPIEIGLWVGSDASPNWLGGKGDTREDTAVRRVRAYRSGRDARAPAPIKACPWCGTAFAPHSFQCVPHADAPTNLEIRCANLACAFTGDRALPIVTVDEAIYRRLPAFLIATVDKFAALPWRGQAGAFFGHVDRADATGFYGAAEPGRGHPIDGIGGQGGGQGGARLDPPDLVIQDELHLISGPLGTVASLYEAAIDRLATREIAGTRIRPKIVASTATVRRAQGQIRALFDRHDTRIFPAPGIDRRDSFFARVMPEGPGDPARWYLGIAAAGRGPKLVFLQALVTLLAGAQGRADDGDDADAYRTALCYFNALRELGGARRIVEDEVATRVARYGTERRRIEPPDRPFGNRTLGEPVELTSRVTTDQVAAAKRRLEATFDGDGEGEGAAAPVDVALATNMISVGLDIDRLGLMLVQGQPKTAAEYIQATSRVGRNPARPGLVVVILNVHRPRDRMHFEQFGHFHDTFYRAVEATSVTPWSARALDRALAAVVVAIVRHLDPALTPSDAVAALAASPHTRAAVVRHLVDRAPPDDAPGGVVGGKARLAALIGSLLDDWVAVAADQTALGTAFSYEDRPHRLLHPPLDPAPPTDPAHRRFQAGWSMRDVEPGVLIRPRGPDGEQVTGAADLE